MNKATFSKYTEKIRAALPFWFEMKKKPSDSVGLDFLSIFGIQLDDIEKMLNYASKQYFIDTADVNSIDIVYKVNLPSYYDTNNILGIYSKNIVLEVVDTLYEFFGIEDRLNNLNHVYDQYNLAFIDNINKVVFVRVPFNNSKLKPYGEITINYDGNKVDFDLNIHHVWNFFDEFGSLVGCQRLTGENNLNYKERILDVFKNPANSTKIGLANGIARELDLRENVKWQDMAYDFVIKDKMVIVDTITVNGDRVYDIKIDPQGHIVLPGDELLSSLSADVSYIRGFSIEPLIEKHTNKALSNELYNSDGSPTHVMLNYINKIKLESSILWGDFIYDEAIWIKDEEDYYSNHFSFIPARMDAKIGGFEKYGFAD